MSELRTEMSEHKKGDERTAAWRYCECRVCKELQEEEEILLAAFDALEAPSKIQPSAKINQCPKSLQDR